MIHISLSNANYLYIEIDGKIYPGEMESAVNQFLRLASDLTSGQLLYKIEHFSLPSLSAVAIKLRHLPELFKCIQKFDRAAVVTDKKWLQTVAELEGKLMPGLEIKGFDLDNFSAAEAWLAGS
ncbi:STAS/SEC14 domain-containing protein [Endozoicomonas ascidiicola]|uniref:STAS/SEC14 domain-containing protein n=1 Tax=Endozoicomonas ascidiicola TaxID=1698521 RepID=UPI00082B04DB|nr:STAS/SEC14 domain-containing protein [Endozoicomonas ascidiicola]